MKKFLILSLLSWSLVSFAQVPRVELDQQVLAFVAKMNARFDLRVAVEVTEECGFRATEKRDEEDEPIQGEYVISYCDNDINFFTKLSTDKDPAESLLSIIGHEYAHFLLDFDISEDAANAAETRQVEVSTDLLIEIKSNDEVLKKLRTIIAGQEVDEDEEPQSEDEQLGEMIDNILMLGTHENVDTLSAKLLELAGLEAKPSVLLYMPDIYGESSVEMLNMIKARMPELQTSVDEGLGDWSNFVCVTGGRELNGFNPALKKAFVQAEYHLLLTAASADCTQSVMMENFYKLLEKYYPN